MMIRRSVWLIAAAVGASILPVALAPVHAQSTQTSVTDTTFQVARDAVIEVTVRNGKLVVRGEDRASAELRANGANYEIRSSRVGVMLDVNERGGRNRSTRRSGNSRSDDADVELIVPRAVRLVIHGNSADVSVANVSGDVEVTLVNGDFESRALGGRAIIQTMTGDVRMTEGVGDLRVTTASGDVSASGVRGSVEVDATSGSVTMVGDRLGRVKIGLVSGDIDLTGALAEDARLQLATHSGDVSLRLPESAAGQLDVTTYNGSVRAGMMTMVPPIERSFSGGSRNGNARRYEFGGGGTARITVSTFSGDISIQRGARRGSDE